MSTQFRQIRRPTARRGSGPSSASAFAGALFATMALGAAPTAAKAAPVAATAACANLTRLSIANTTVTSSTLVPASGGTPAYCDVLATSAPETDMEIRLPLNWRGRYLHLGGGGFDGTIATNVPASFNVDLIADEFVVAGSNGGHRATQYPGASFAAIPALVLGYAHTAISQTDTVAHALMAAFYGHGPQYRYFDGCSNGGKNASIAASLLGDSYDGVIGGDGVYGHADDDTGGSDMPGLTAAWARATQVGSTHFDPATLGPKLTALYNAEVAQCDALDGLTDGIISNPAACHFNPALLQCPNGTNTNSCLTPTEVQAVKSVMTDLVLDGKVIGAPYGLGNLVVANDTLGLPGAFGGGAFGLGQGFLAMAYGNPAYNPLSSWNLQRDFGFVVNQFDNVDDMTGPLEGSKGIAHFVKKGGKLIVWNGAEDTLVPAADSVRFVAGLLFDLELSSSYNQTRNNVRYYSLPGVGHCGGGPGADAIDLLTPLTKWVENDRAPDTLTAAKVVDNAVTFTRPMCVYPQYPLYNGAGDRNNAASFHCVKPQGTPISWWHDAPIP